MPYSDYDYSMQNDIKSAVKTVQNKKKKKKKTSASNQGGASVGGGT